MRSALTGDLDLLAAMNRPVFSFSGVERRRVAGDRFGGALGSLVDVGLQAAACYRRSADKPGPQTCCSTSDAPAGFTGRGPARPLWTYPPPGRRLPRSA